MPTISIFFKILTSFFLDTLIIAQDYHSVNLRFPLLAKL
nr:MAG TPA: Erythromycin resistance leader peptide [Caudoviricetes sp.]